MTANHNEIYQKVKDQTYSFEIVITQYAGWVCTWNKTLNTSCTFGECDTFHYQITKHLFQGHYCCLSRHIHIICLIFCKLQLMKFLSTITQSSFSNLQLYFLSIKTFSIFYIGTTLFTCLTNGSEVNEGCWNTSLSTVPSSLGPSCWNLDQSRSTSDTGTEKVNTSCMVKIKAVFILPPLQSITIILSS